MKEETFVKMKNVICYFFGHKADKTMLAYNIKSHDTAYVVKIYEVSKCSRCNKIYEKPIDWYQNYALYVEFAIRKKEKEFCEQHIMHISEAYTLLKGDEEYSNDNTKKLWSTSLLV